MKIVLIFFVLLSPFFAKEIKQKAKPIKKTEQTKPTVFKEQKINLSPTINILEIKPTNEIKYNLNSRYAPILKYKDKQSDFESDYKLGVDYSLNQETGKLEKLKFDIETKFRGIN